MKIITSPAESKWFARFSILKSAEIAFLCFGLLALGYAAYVLAGAVFYQSHAIGEFRSASPAIAAAQPRPLKETLATSAPEIKEGMPIARLEIPRLGVDEVVVQGADDGDLRHAIGHIPATAFPGELGNVGIAGHRDTFFRPLERIRRGDLITIVSTSKTYRYRVDDTEVVLPGATEVLNATEQPSLTLVTCFPFYYVGSAPKRFIVRAHELPSGQPGL